MIWRSPMVVTALAVAVAACGAPSEPATGDATASDGSAADAAAPPPPAGLRRWLLGDPADVRTTATAGLILMGGGSDVDAAFAWQRDRIGGGDIVVLRASGAEGYNPYLFEQIGGADSVETMIVDSAALAAEPYVRWQLDRAEAIFIAGGDQADYVRAWRDTPVAAALDAAPARGAVLGGTSAGCAILGGVVYTARNGTVYSDEALADPYNPYMTLERDVLHLATLDGVVTDTHFATRDRMGRLLAFVARTRADALAARPIGLGIDEGTAVVIDESGAGEVMGAGAVYMIAPGDAAPATCRPGEALAWAEVPLHTLRAGDRLVLGSGTSSVSPRSLSCAGGVLSPADPY